jgi:hypothetical protein
MTTVKTENKKVEAGAQTKVPKQEDLAIACEIHTLAHIVYSELATPAPWMPPGFAPHEFQPPSGFPPSMSMCGPTLTEPVHWPL